MNITRTARDIQLDRLLHYPKNRICFLKDSNVAAAMDKADIERFRRREIQFSTLKRCIARNNLLPDSSITDEALEAFLISIGEMTRL